MKVLLAIFIAVSTFSSLHSYEYNHQKTQGTYKEGAQRANSNREEYFAPMTEQEKRDISYIIMTLSTKSQISLVFEKKELNRAGDRVSHVHPLKFLLYIFSDGQLKNAVKNIKGLPWNRFVSGMAGSLEKAASRSTIKEEYIADFSKTVGVDTSIFAASLQKRQWEEFINTVRNHLP